MVRLTGQGIHFMSDDLTYQFVDTNILVYAHDTAAGRKHQLAKNLLSELWESGNGCLSIQVLQEFYVTITRKVAKPLLPSQASSIIEYLSTWRIHSPQARDIVAAIQIQKRFDTSFWDAMIIQSATRLDCKTVWSEDLNHGQYYANVRLLNPFTEQ